MIFRDFCVQYEYCMCVWVFLSIVRTRVRNTSSTVYRCKYRRNNIRSTGMPVFSFFIHMYIYICEFVLMIFGIFVYSIACVFGYFCLLYVPVYEVRVVPCTGTSTVGIISGVCLLFHSLYTYVYICEFVFMIVWVFLSIVRTRVRGTSSTVYRYKYPSTSIFVFARTTATSTRWYLPQQGTCSTSKRTPVGIFTPEHQTLSLKVASQTVEHQIIKSRS
jgi:hypothetical protein